MVRKANIARHMTKSSVPTSSNCQDLNLNVQVSVCREFVNFSKYLLMNAIIVIDMLRNILIPR